MALTGSFSGSIRDGKYTLRVDWSATQNVADNTSTITCNHYLVIASNYWVDVNSRSNSTTIDGTAISWTSPAVDSHGSTVHLGSVSRTVAHSSDGTKSLSISATYNIQMSAGGTYWSSINASTSVTLDTIPRATTPSISGSATMGGTMTINLPRASGSFTHTVTYAFGGASGTIATGAGTSANWVIPLALANQIPNSTSGAGSITCYTYNGGTHIGTKSISMTLYVSGSMVPSLSYTVAEAGGVTLGVYVQGKSRIKVTLSASGTYGSAIRSYNIQANGTTYTSSTATTGYLLSAGSNTITMAVTDSRGRTTTKTTTINVLAYSAPWVNSLTAYRCKEDGTADDQGAYAKVATAGGITAISGNARALRIEYRKTGASGYTRQDITLSTYTWDTSIILPGIDIDSSWEIRAVATDTFGSTVKAVSLSTAAVTMDYRSGGKGVAFGKVAEYDKTVEIAADWALKRAGLAYATDERGTWTPYFYSDSGTAATYAKQFGMYIKIGRLVIVVATLQLSSKGNLSGGLSIRGFPFPKAADSVGYYIGAPAFHNFPVGPITMEISGGNSSPLSWLYHYKNGTVASVFANEIPNNATLEGATWIYFTD